MEALIILYLKSREIWNEISYWDILAMTQKWQLAVHLDLCK